MASTDPNKVLIVGFGYVGRALAERLVDTGYQVYALRRTPITLAEHGGVRAYCGDARDISRINGLPEGIGQIVCATSPDERTEEAYRRAYPEVVAALLAHFHQARIVLVSSTAVYTQVNGELVDDHAPAAATHPTARQLRSAEELLLHPLTGQPLRHAAYAHHVVLRASGIYGPGRVRLLSSLLHHELGEDEAKTFSCRIHRDDLVGIVEFLLKKPNLAGVFNATDPTPATLGEMAAWVRGRFEPNTLKSEPRTSRDRKNRRIVPARLLDLGYCFRFPSYIEGYGHVLSQPQTPLSGP